MLLTKDRSPWKMKNKWDKPCSSFSVFPQERFQATPQRKGMQGKLGSLPELRRLCWESREAQTARGPWAEPWRGGSHTKWRSTREICRWLSSILWLGTDQTCMCGNCPRLGTELPERIRGNNLRSWELELVSVSTSLIEKPYNAEASHRGRKKILLQYWVRISSRLNAALPPPKKVQGQD